MVAYTVLIKSINLFESKGNGFFRYTVFHFDELKKPDILNRKYEIKIALLKRRIQVELQILYRWKNIKDIFLWLFVVKRFKIKTPIYRKQWLTNNQPLVNRQPN